MDNQGLPVFRTGADVRQQTKARRAVKRRRSVLLVICVLLPLAVGGALGSLLFDGPPPPGAVWVKTIGISLFATFITGGVIFSVVMFQMLRLGQHFVVSKASMIRTMLEPEKGEQHERFDPLILSVALTAIGSILAMSLIGPVARHLASPVQWEPKEFVVPAIGGLVGAVVGGILAAIVGAITQPQPDVD